MKVPLLRPRGVSPARAPVLRYGVALLSVILALIPALLLSDLVESRLVVFAVAVMVSAWYGGWKPGLVATSFALTVSAYFSLGQGHSPTEYRRAIIHLILFVVVALLICWFNAALRSAQEGLWRSEINFRSLVTNAPYGICRCNASGVLLSANPALVAMLGYSTQAELVGRSLPTLFRESQQWFTAADHFRAAERFTGLIADWVRRDSAPLTVRLSALTIRDQDHTTYFELFAEDVTVQRGLEQQLRQAQKMEAVGRLAGGIAHDFNNLLMVISGYCEFLLDEVGEKRSIRGPAEEISKAAKRAISLTSQLLAFGRKQMLAPKVLDLNEVVDENLKLLTRLIGENIELVMNPGRELGLVKADPGQMEQVIMNLAVNARDAMPQGGKLTIETANVTIDMRSNRTAPAEPGDYVMLAVSDTGSGMDAETQSHIFEPFFTTKGTKGTGLGLSTVYGIVKQSGGYIWVSSEPNRGTAFRIYLPRVSEAGEEAALEAPVTWTEVPRGHETILLAEDETTVRALTRQYLETLGYRVFEAPDAAAALEISNAHDGPIHLLLTDVIMPGMNGRQLAQKIVSARPEIRVLYMSGYSENVVGHDGTLEAGINLLQKPFALPTLRTKIRQVLDRPPSEEALMVARSAHARRRIKPSPLRAQRFTLHLPLRYREVGAPEWRAGTTENISRSGMLFQAEGLMLPNVQLEINLVLPPEIAGLTSAEVLCRGEIVRALGAQTPATKPMLAAKILQYQFQQGARMAEA
jgi:PAS domain S-box-containing protein